MSFVYWVSGIVLGGAALAYLALVGVLYVAQRHLLYHPTDERPHPEGVLAHAVEILSIPAHDGLDLYSWWLPPATPESPVIVYFHGNAGNQTDREVRMGLYRGRGWGALLPTYRYNAGSGGIASEEALIADGRAVLAWLRAQGIGPERTILYGESLGTGIAVALVSEASLEGRRIAAGIVLDAPYDSVVAVARRVYWYVPVDRLLHDRFDSAARIKSVDIPILIGHGDADRVIDIRHGRALFDAANEPKTFAFKPGGGHTDLYEFGFLDDVAAFIADVTD
ncbi:alpha/beta hydrolase [Rhodospirillaceae bacterium KN72]|uniref:Alpha/beta hydrolase n=1 Tax=Pacificispira spongiicola TaxID=2729598 RepID=A0A7Y0E0B1_9PROT|nr:alpha/beta hydrolase [Pacificispira spongiicola]NMM44116.1 alpha/beta hydrolase [Pacificispira spongiicola]